MGKMTEQVKIFGLLMILRTVYSYFLRELIKRAIDDPNEIWDDSLMEIMDRLFGYEEPK